MKTLFKALVAVSLIAGAGAASAATTTAPTSFNVTANIAGFCQINSASAIGFGAVSASTVANNDKTGTIAHQCTKGTAYTIKLDAGANGSFAARKMLDSVSGDTLDYNLYTDSGRTTVWNDTTQTVTGTASLFATTISTTIYARLVEGQDKSAGSYSDTVNVTITY